MSFHLEMPNNIIFISCGIFGWLIVLILASRQYLKQKEKPAYWRVIIVVWVGLFSFSINLDIFHIPMKLSILPLGVWIVYGFLTKKSWQKYRPFAWIGFWANFIFIGTALMSGFIDNWVYPKEDPSTYISDIEHAIIVAIHPTAQPACFNKDRFQSQLSDVQFADVLGMEWYQDSVLESGSHYHKEYFPYGLLGTTPRWGSGLEPLIYLKEDGRGILITTSNRSYYYLSKEPLIDWGGCNNE